MPLRYCVTIIFGDNPRQWRKLRKFEFWFENRKSRNLWRYCTFVPPPPSPFSYPPPFSWRNAAESFTVALTLTLGGGTKVQLGHLSGSYYTFIPPVCYWDSSWWSVNRNPNRAIAPMISGWIEVYHQRFMI